MTKTDDVSPILRVANRILKGVQEDTEYLVTGDGALLALHNYERLRIMALSDFLQVLA